MFNNETPVSGSTLTVVEELKSNNQDFEFYPTTQAQIGAISSDLNQILKSHDISYNWNKAAILLDIGAGDGRVLDALHKTISKDHSTAYKGDLEKHAIEKAPIHTSRYRGRNITLVGTDFNETNLISKRADIAFCNPPYSQFELWMETILKQLNFGLLYMIVPERWKNNELINEAIKSRQIKTTKIIAESNFMDADRVARGKVNIVRFAFNDFDKEAEDYFDEINRFPQRCERKYLIGSQSSDPFRIFIEQELGLKKTVHSANCEFNEIRQKERIKQKLDNPDDPLYEISVNKGVLHALLESYNKDITKTLTEYKKISALDPALLAELGVEYKSICDGVKSKLFGYRAVYWRLLFTHLDTLYKRVTKSKREKLLNTLNSTSLDFTYKNAIYIISYAVEMTNELAEESLIDLFCDLTSPESIKSYYKSNEHVFTDDWRFRHGDQKKRAKVLLDYRFIYSGYSNFSQYEYDHGLNEYAKDFTRDLSILFTLIGYQDVYICGDMSSLEGGETISIQGLDLEYGPKKLLQIKYYKNGNRHLRFDQDAMQRLNVTVSRLLGWVRDQTDFENETGVKASDRDWKWKEGIALTPQNVLKLTDNTIRA